MSEYTEASTADRSAECKKKRAVASACSSPWRTSTITAAVPRLLGLNTGNSEYTRADHPRVPTQKIALWAKKNRTSRRGLALAITVLNWVN